MIIITIKSITTITTVTTITTIMTIAKSLSISCFRTPQTGEVPTKRKNKAYAVIKNEMEERERAKKRQSKNVGWPQILFC